MLLKLDYINTNHQNVSTTFDEQNQAWVSGIRVGSDFACPSVAAQGILSAVDDIDMISRATLIDSEGNEVDLPE